MTAAKKAARKRAAKAESRLVPARLAKLVPGLGAARRRPDPTCWLKLEAPGVGWAWWVIEYSPRTGIAYGLVQGLEVELGEFSVPELEAEEGPGRVERNRVYLPQRLSEVKKWEARQP